eukprot:1923800-Rhodomonas_salina.1
MLFRASIPNPTLRRIRLCTATTGAYICPPVPRVGTNALGTKAPRYASAFGRGGPTWGWRGRRARMAEL